MYFTSRYSSIPCFPPSRPTPLSLTPPNGAAAVDTAPVLAPTIPASSASPTRHILSASLVYTYAANPDLVSFAIAIASASVSNEKTAATGPKVSSEKTRALPGALREHRRTIIRKRGVVGGTLGTRAFAARERARASLERVRHVRFDLFQRMVVYQRALVDADDERRRARGELLGENVGDGRVR